MNLDERNSTDEIPTVRPDNESQIFDQFAARLLRFARSRLPSELNPRLDSDDIVQSVFRTFFRRQRSGEFQFESAEDIWRLLAAITWRKVVNTVKHHRRDRRDVSRESGGNSETGDPGLSAGHHLEPGPVHLAILAEELAKILEQLNPAARQILQLRLDGHSIEEISQQVSLSQRTVKRSLAKAREVASRRLQDV